MTPEEVLVSMADPNEYKEGFHLGLPGDGLGIELEMGQILKELVQNKKKILEVGTGRGYSTSWLMIGAPEAEIYSVDNTDRAPFIWDQIGLTKKPMILRGEMKEVIDQVPEEIDFVFHDASHATHFVIPDLDEIEPKLASKCMITIHDTKYASQMGSDVKDHFKRKGWDYREIDKSCGLGIAERK